MFKNLKITRFIYWVIVVEEGDDVKFLTFEGGVMGGGGGGVTKIEQVRTRAEGGSKFW